MTAKPFLERCLYWIRLPFVQISLNGETFVCFHLWHYLMCTLFVCSIPLEQELL